MNEYRRGKAWCITDNGVEHFLELVPVRPRGWMIRKNGAFIYGKQAFMYGHATLLIDRIERSLKMRNLSGKPCKFETVHGLLIEPQNAPKDALFLDENLEPDLDPLLMRQQMQDSMDKPTTITITAARSDEHVPKVAPKRVSKAQAPKEEEK